MKNILFFGDSLTAGYGLEKPSLESLPALIQDKLDAGNFGCKTINSGVSGETSSGGLSRIDLVLKQQIDIFVLELGINDLFRSISYRVTEQNLQSIIDKVVRKYPGAKLVLLGMEAPAYIAGKYGIEFRALFRRIAEKNDMAFLPFLLDGVAGIPHLNIHDGLHPSANGYRVIADKVWEVLEPLVKQINS